MAKAAVDKGATALKWDPSGGAGLFISTAEIHAAIDCVAAIREAVGHPELHHPRVVTN